MRLFLSFIVALLLLPGFPAVAQSDQQTLHDRIDVLRAGKFTEGTVSEANRLLLLARAAEDPGLVTDIALWLSRYYTSMGSYEQAMVLCGEATKAARTMENPRRIADVELSIGTIQYRAGNYERSISILQPLVDEYKALGDTLQAGKSEASIALNYYALNKTDSALQKLLLARAVIVAYDSPSDLLVVDQNLGAIYAEKGRPEQGLPYTDQSLSIILSEKDTFQFAPAYGNLAYTFQELGDFERALPFYDSSLHYSRLQEQDAITSVTLQDLSRGYKMVGDYKNALKNFEKHHALKASVLNEKTMNRIAELEVLHKTERKRLALEASEQKVFSLEQEAQLRNQRLVLIVVGLFSSLLVVLLVFLQWRKDIRYRETQKKLIAAELVNERLTSGQLSTQLENQQEDLTDFALDIERKNRFSRELTSRLDALKKELPPQFRSQLNELVYFTQNHDKLNENLEMIQENIDQVNHEFQKKLRGGFPKLTSSDIELAGMLRLNMTNKEVAANRGISTASAKMARYRLRKKLSLKATDDIHTFLREL